MILTTLPTVTMAPSDNRHNHQEPDHLELSFRYGLGSNDSSALHHHTSTLTLMKIKAAPHEHTVYL